MMNGLLPVFMVTLSLLNGQGLPPRAGPIVVDHTCADVTRIPQGAILEAKAKLHIAYGHTSHGSQLISGMNELVGFANGGGKGLALPKGVFTWRHGGANGALDLHDSAMAGDVGYYPDWVDNTRAYLNNPQNADVNVVMWSWCGQVSGKYSGNKLLTEYLEPMSQLERDYPHVTFVYMTGHVDHSDDANNKAANQVIRDYCKATGKVLYDFADIESFDPDGVYYPFPNDSCEYFASRTGASLGNWARQWQNTHTVNVDWYSCDSAHSEPLNANLKAYAAWWLFARLAGWPGTPCQSGTGDLNCDGKVNLSDLAVLAENWLKDQ